ncbi:MAG: hypothetical protein ACI97B_001433, partial [Verrucomicrobiales bacterium]
HVTGKNQKAERDTQNDSPESGRKAQQLMVLEYGSAFMRVTMHGPIFSRSAAQFNASISVTLPSEKTTRFVSYVSYCVTGA